MVDEPGPEFLPETLPRMNLLIRLWLRRWTNTQHSRIISYNVIKCVLSKLIMDFSSIKAFPSSSLLVLTNSSSAISPIVVLNRLNILFCFVGRRCRIGNTGPMRNTKCDRKPVSPLPKDSKTSTTAESLPSKAWKSCPKPAIPIESRLKKGID